MIKNLIFDFGKVLVNHDLQPLLERHFGDDEVSLIGFHKILSDPEFINMCDRGIIPFEKMIDGAIKRYPEYSDAFTFFKDNYLEEITGEIEGMHVLLIKAIRIQTIWVDELERHNLPGHGEIRHIPVASRCGNIV